MTLMTNMTFTEHKAVEAPKRSHAHTQEIFALGTGTGTGTPNGHWTGPRRLPRCYSPY